jgi:hypothetical protein
VIDTRVDAPAPPAAARPRWAIRWFTIFVAGLVVVGLVVPWERWCSPSIDGSKVSCFNAWAWGGSASLFGLLLLIASVAFVALAVLRRWTSSAGVTAVAAGLGVAVLVAAGVKVVVLLADAHAYTSAETGPSPAFVGVWLGLVLGIGAFFALFVALADIRPNAWSWLVMAAVAVILVGLAIPYAVSGLAWWGGPLAPPDFLGGGNAAGYGASPGQPVYFDGLLYIENRGGLPTVLDGLDAVEVTPGLRVQQTYVLTGCGGGTVSAANFDRCTAPLEGFAVKPGREGGRLGAVLTVPSPGRYTVGWWRIRYHVGPLRFEVFRTDQLVVCAPPPGHADCGNH